MCILGILEVPGSKPSVAILDGEHVLPKGHRFTPILSASHELLEFLRASFGDETILDNWKKGQRVNYLYEYVAEEE